VNKLSLYMWSGIRSGERLGFFGVRNESCFGEACGLRKSELGIRFWSSGACEGKKYCVDTG